MNDVQELIRRLNPQQREAYETVFSPLIVMAPAGTGKTDVLALRAYHALSKGIRADRMLLITFTNRAARSMRKRLEEVMGDIAKNVQISTFHGLCGYILREESQNLSLSRDFIILDEEDARLILREILSQKRLIRGMYYNEERFVMDFFRMAREYPWIHEEKPDIREYFIQTMNERKLSFGWFADVVTDVFYQYQRRLREYGMMDFTALVTGVLSAFENPSIRQRWQNRYDWLELDEVQDTNKIEYMIIRNLYMKHYNIGLFGDLRQTIYEWRGSVPHEIIQNFKLNSPGYKEVRFTENYRSTKTILHAADSFLSYEEHPSESLEEAAFDSLPQDRIKIRSFRGEEDEGRYLARQIKELKDTGTPYHSMAVLSRTNKEAGKIGVFLEKQGIPVFLVEKTKFFSREEIKDALSYLKLMLNPKDVLSLKRLYPESTERFLGEDQKRFVTMEQLLDLSNYESGDPYSRLIEAFEKDDIVVFDVETTGLDVKSDRVIQIAALRGGKSGICEKLERFIRIEGSVGESYEIHRISDEHLAEHGIDAEQAFKDFEDFLGESALIGHNVYYDICITRENMARYSLSDPFEHRLIYDTLALSRIIYPGLRRYNLESLFEQIGLSHRPTHNAMDDVIATLQLVEAMVKKLVEEKAVRRQFFLSYADLFYPAARNLSDLKALCETKRPQDIMHEALLRSGFLERYRERKDQLQKLRELYRIFREYDDVEKSSGESITFLLEVASLGNDTDRILRSKDQVPVITVHQSKGLEFDAVFIYSATDEHFPSTLSKSKNSMREERRLFYVAMTRAKKQLYITYHIGPQNEQMPSRFIHQINRKYLDYQ